MSHFDERSPGLRGSLPPDRLAKEEYALADAWSREEVEATVADYFEMLSAELRGEPYNKAEHRRRLQPLLDDRSEGAIERKHGNISALLIEFGYPYIEGYKPYSNYQRLLFQVVSDRLEADRTLESLVEADVEAEVELATMDDILAALVDPPRPMGYVDRVSEPPPERFGGPSALRRVDYLQREAANRSLGSAGEIFVVDFERARLAAAGQDRLAAKIEHVSRTRGDGAGFDILSFEVSGRERLIEVKTTKYGAQTPFFVTANEVKVSERETDQYHLYRVFGFRRAPRLYDVPGSIAAHFRLDPTQYAARFRQ